MSKNVVISVGATLLVGALAFGGFYMIAGGGSKVASVNGEKITKSEYQAALDKRFGVSILDKLVGEKLIMQEAKKDKFTATDKEINAKIDELKKQFPTEAMFKQKLKEYGMTLDDLKDEMKFSILLKKISLKDVKITDKELKDTYEMYKDRFIEQEKVRAKHILVKTQAEADAILADLKKGADFDKLAKEKSIDTSNKDKGGDLGYFTATDMVPEFSKAAFAAKKGELTGVVKTSFGFHIIKVLDKKPMKKPTFDEVKDKIKEILEGQRAKDMTQVVQELKDKAKIDFSDQKFESIVKKPENK